MPVAIRLQQIVREERSERITESPSNERKNRPRRSASARTNQAHPATRPPFHAQMGRAPVVIVFVGRRLNASAENRERRAEPLPATRNFASVVLKWVGRGSGLRSFVMNPTKMRASRRPNAPIIGAASFLRDISLPVELARNVKR